MKVTIYSTPTCPYCKMAKRFFADNNVEFEDNDVSTNNEKAHEMMEKSGQQGVPVITVEKEGKEEVIIGFDQSKLEESLGIKSGQVQ